MNEKQSPELVTAIEKLTAEIHESNSIKKEAGKAYNKQMRYLMIIVTVLGLATTVYYVLDYLKC